MQLISDPLACAPVVSQVHVVVPVCEEICETILGGGDDDSVLFFD